MQLDAEATEHEVAAVEEVLAGEGFEPRIEATWRKPPHTGNGPMWMILIPVGVPLAYFLRGYATRLGEKAAEETAEWLRSFVKRLRAAREPSPAADGWITFRGTDGTQLDLANIPDEAFNALYELDLPELIGAHLMWDHERRQWRNAHTPPGQEHELPRR